MKPSKLNLHYHPTTDELARYVAEELIALLLLRSDLSVPFGIALSGGRIAEKFYQSIVDASRHNPVSFENVHFFWADERCVPPSDPQSNFAIAQSNLFEPLEIEAGNIHRIQGEEDFDFAAKEAEAELCHTLPSNAQGIPLLDVVILGMGEDGHVASLFPSEGPESIADLRVYRHVVAAKPPPDRITLGYETIRRATNVWVLASGAGKADALRELLAGKDLPIQRVVAGRDTTTIFQDSVKNF